jgi:hypothetical protein
MRAGVDLAQAHVPTAHRADGPREAPPVAVEHRQRPQVDALRAQPGLHDLAEGVEVGAPVVVDRALGLPGRARGVVDRDRLVLVGEDHGQRLVRAPGEEVLVRVAPGPGVVDPDDPLDRRPVAVVAIVDQVGVLVVDEHQPRARVPQDEPDVVGGEAVVHGDEHPARRRDAVVGLEQRRDVRGDERDPVALLQARVPQGRCQAPHPSGELPVGVAAVLVDDRHLVRVHELAAPQERDRVELAAVGPPHLRCVTDLRHVATPPGTQSLVRSSAGSSTERRRIFPVGPLGSSSSSQTWRGYL